MDNFRVLTALKQATMTQFNSAPAKPHKHDERVEARQRRNTLLLSFLFGLAKITTEKVLTIYLVIIACVLHCTACRTGSVRVFDTMENHRLF